MRLTSPIFLTFFAFCGSFYILFYNLWGGGSMYHGVSHIFTAIVFWNFVWFMYFRYKTTVHIEIWHMVKYMYWDVFYFNYNFYLLNFIDFNCDLDIIIILFGRFSYFLIFILYYYILNIICNFLNYIYMYNLFIFLKSIYLVILSFFVC